MKLSFLIAAFFGSAIILSSCKKEDSSTPASDPVQALLTDFGPKIAEPIYSKLHTEALVLKDRITVLKNSPIQSNLVSAQNQWYVTRSAWEQSEGMLFGPVDTEGLDPAIDTWPVYQVEIEGRLGTTDVFTESYVDTLADGLKGFHPIEYLLFGKSRSRTVNELTNRQLEYLVALSSHLALKTEAMHHGWISSGGNYSNELATSGKGSVTYPKRFDGVEEIAKALIGIVSEVGETKIEIPFVEKDSLREESPFAINSWKDFSDNLLGAKNIYMGTVNGNTSGSLHAVVAKYNASLDAQIQGKFDDAVTNLNSYTIPFGRAIHQVPGQVQSTQTRLKSLQTQMEAEMIPLLQLHIKD